MHAGGVQPEEEGFVVGPRLVQNLRPRPENLVVDGLHPFRTQRPVVLDLLLADLAPARLHGRIVDRSGVAVDHVAGPAQRRRVRRGSAEKR